MMTVREVAASYNVSTAFMARALEQVGFENAQDETLLSTVTITSFEAAFGAKVREAQSKRIEAEPSAPSRGHSEPHIMRVAHSKVGAGRDSGGNRVKVLMENPGAVHAIDAAGTVDGDPWRGVISPGDFRFFGGAMNSGPPAACGWQHMRVVLSEQFVPADDPESAGQCVRCAAIVADGQGFRTRPHERAPSFCQAYRRIRVEGTLRVENCARRNFHDGNHRASDGAEWNESVADYVPPPAGGREQ